MANGHVRDVSLIECILKSLRKKDIFVSPGDEPATSDDGLILWINKISDYLRGDHISSSIIIPEIDDLRDLSDGSNIAAALSFMFPEKLPFKSVRFSDPCYTEDIAWNWNLIKRCCDECLSDCAFPYNSVEEFLAFLFPAMSGQHDGINDDGHSIIREFLMNLVRLVANCPDMVKDYQLPFIHNMTSNGTDTFVARKPPVVHNLDRSKLTSENSNSDHISFAQLQSMSPNCIALTDSAAGLNSSKPSDSTGFHTNSSAYLKMMLEERKRNIEANKLQHTADRVSSLDETAKEVFFKLHGKNKTDKSCNDFLPSSSSTSSSKSSQSLTSKLRGKMAANRQARSLIDNSPLTEGFDPKQIQQTLDEMRSQIAQITLGQEKFQAEVIRKFKTSNEDICPTEVEEPKNSSYFEPVLALPKSQSSSAIMTPKSYNRDHFRLHAVPEPPSRLDPSLKLEDHLILDNDNRNNGKTPRKTWDYAQTFTKGSINTNQNFDRGHSPIDVACNNFILNNSTPCHTPSNKIDIPSDLNLSHQNQIDEKISTFDNVPNQSLISSASPTNLSFVYPTCQQRSNSTSKLVHGTNFEPNTSQSSVGFVIQDEDDFQKEDDMEGRKNKFVAATLRRKAKQEARRLKAEQENQKRQEEKARKFEAEEQRKRAKEAHRVEIFERFQREKVEPDRNNSSGVSNTVNQCTTRPLSALGCGVGDSTSTDSNNNGTSFMAQSSCLASVDRPLPTPRGLAARFRAPTGGQRARPRTSRPASHYSTLNCSNVGLTNHNRIMTKSVLAGGSADFLDSFDGKSQNSLDGGSVSGASNEPTHKVFVRPTQRSNRNLILNALRDRVLAGAANTEKKNKVLEELARSDSKHFLILFRGERFQFRGVYSWDQVSDKIVKLYGLGPKVVYESTMKRLFKYDSGTKFFNELPARHLSASIDAFTIADEYWMMDKKATFVKIK